MVVLSVPTQGLQYFPLIDPEGMGTYRGRGGGLGAIGTTGWCLPNVCGGTGAKGKGDHME